MNKPTAVGSLLVIALGAFVAGRFSGGSRQQNPPSAKRVLYYVDPMHPTYRSDKPGTAPDCGMALEPVYEHGQIVRVRSETQRLVGVRVELVERVSGSANLRLYGRVAPDETRVYRVNAGVDGYVREISGVTTGSRVDNGEWLATLAAPDARTPIQSYLVALDAVERGA